MKKPSSRRIGLCILVISVSLLLTFIAGCSMRKRIEPPSWQWLVKAGGDGNNMSRAIDADSEGNLYITGYINGTVTFGETELESLWEDDAFIAKLSPDREWLWVQQISGLEKSSGTNIKVDSQGNCYLSGIFEGETMFGETKLDSGEQTGDFLAKLNTRGEWLWVKDFKREERSSSLTFTLDSDDNLYLTGAYSGFASFGSNKLNGGTETYIFAAKIDTEGNLIRTTKATTNEIGRSPIRIAADNQGNIFVSGSFKQPVTFGNNVLDNKGTEDVFVAKINEQGNWSRAVIVENNSEIRCLDLSVDSRGNCFIAGDFDETIRLGRHELRAGKNRNLYIAKLNNDGEWDWAVAEGGKHSAYVSRIILDSREENLYLSGSISILNIFSLLKFYPLSVRFGNYRLKFDTPAMNSFVAKINTEGKWQWATVTSEEEMVELKQQQEPEKTWWQNRFLSDMSKTDVFLWSMALDKDDNCYVAGSFMDNSDMVYSIFTEQDIGGVSYWEIYVSKLGSGEKH